MNIKDRLIEDKSRLAKDLDEAVEKLNEYLFLIDVLQTNLDTAIEALKYYQSSDGTVKSLVFNTKVANDAIEKLEK